MVCSTVQVAPWKSAFSSELLFPDLWLNLSYPLLVQPDLYGEDRVALPQDRLRDNG